MLYDIQDTAVAHDSQATPANPAGDPWEPRSQQENAHQDAAAEIANLGGAPTRPVPKDPPYTEMADTATV